MTDKERLEEIKSQVWKEKCTYAKGDDESREGYSYTLSDYDFEWLIQQAERVQELEEVLLQNKYDKALYEKKVIEWLELKEENKRYREAIDRALKEGFTIKDCDEVINHIYGILGEALEGEK